MEKSKKDYYNLLTDRNKGIISNEQQSTISRSKIAIAGCGADGGSPAISLARLGITKFSLADPDNFDFTNVNRQEGAFENTVGQNKAKTIAEIIKKINPYAQVKVFNKGVNKDNIKEFLNGVDLLLEEIDYREPKHSLIVHREAKKEKIPVFMTISVAWNALLFYFDPEDMSYEEYMTSTSTEDFVDLDSYIPELPKYVPEKLLREVLEKKIEIPVVESAVKMSAAMISAYCIFYLTGAKKIRSVPFYYSAGDLFTKRAKLSIKKIE